MNHRISMRDLLLLGRFGRLTPGADRSVVLESLGTPDDHGVDKGGWRASPIWCYGNFELHFEGARGDDLTLIYADRFPLSAGPIPVDLCGLSSTMSIEGMLAVLDNWCVRDAIQRPSALNPGCEELVIGRALCLFCESDDGDGLQSISVCVRSEATRW